MSYYGSVVLDQIFEVVVLWMKKHADDTLIRCSPIRDIGYG